MACHEPSPPEAVPPLAPVPCHDPPPPDAVRGDAASCLGGVVVATADGTLKVVNTLDERLRISYEQNVPQMRVQVFGKSGGHLRT